MSNQKIMDNEKAEYRDIKLEVGYILENKVKKPIIISAKFGDKLFFESVCDECKEIFLNKKPLDTLITLVEDYCEATYDFNNTDFRLESQHMLFRKVPIFSIVFNENFKINLEFTKEIIDIVLNWETKTGTLYSDGYHKGTGYFWLAEHEFKEKRYDKGFLYLALAIAEDKRFIKNEYQYQGGFLAASLVYKREKNSEPTYHKSTQLSPIIDELKRIVDDYITNFSSNFKYSKFVEEFLLNDDSTIEFYKICFTRTFTNFCDYIHNFKENYFDNPLTTPILFQYLFNFTVLFEEMLKFKISSFTKLGTTIRNLVTFRSWITQADYNALNDYSTGIYCKDWETDPSNFPILLNEAIDLTFNTAGVTFPNKKAALLITMRIFRNLGAHNIPKGLITNKATLKKIFDVICFAFLTIVEEYYISP